mmetsp:Transcript_20115/g.17813  ORF Transcript_20115/g.17813 Transcript_20115/m.17813 type:complete len:96 (+) Transcript_20115:165-452(+)
MTSQMTMNQNKQNIQNGFTRQLSVISSEKDSISVEIKKEPKTTIRPIKLFNMIKHKANMKSDLVKKIQSLKNKISLKSPIGIHSRQTTKTLSTQK